MKKRLLCLILSLALAVCLCPAALALDTAKDSGLLVLVNKTHLIPADFVPATQRLQGSAPVTAASVALRPEAVKAYAAMYQAMKADGVTAFYGLSGYRSYATQSYLVNSRVNAQISAGLSRQAAYNSVTVYTAPAGASEHQTGLAIDVGAGGGLSYSFAGSAAGKWMKEHAWEYGFILRYEEAKSDLTMIGAEAWHYRYVGVPHAKFIVDHGFCFEEYIDYLHAHGSASVQVGDAWYDIFWTDDSGRKFPQSSVLDLSSDNAGGWIVTTLRPEDPLAYVRDHWSKDYFLQLKELGVVFDGAVFPDAAVTSQELGALCGTGGGDGSVLTREQAACFLAPFLSERQPVRLFYQDLDQIDAAALPGVRLAVSNGLFSHGIGLSFQPKEPLTWAQAAVLALHFRSLPAARP